MNKYLLLRNNKQSGPYTVSELIAIGIKAYDLVWLEGRSAAWRYPSEIDELKSFSPATEEQPFDRFYKKPAATAQTTESVKPTDHSRFEPKVIAPATRVTLENGSKKVYVNFPASARGAEQRSRLSEAEIPASNSRPEDSTQQPAQPSFRNDSLSPTTPPVQPEEQNETFITQRAVSADSPAAPFEQEKPWATAKTPTYSEPPVGRFEKENASTAAQMPAFRKSTPRFEQDTPSLAAQTPAYPEAPASRYVRPRQDKKWRHATIIACFLLFVLVSVGIINYSSQKKSLENLSRLVEQMEQREKQMTSSITAASYEDPAPQAPDAVSESGVTPPASLPDPTLNTPTSVANQISPAKKPAAAIVNKPDITSSPNDAVNEPVQQEPVSPSREVQLPASRVNLFDLVSVKANKYKTGVLGGISNLQLELSNNSPHDLHRVAIEIRYLGPEKKVVRTQTVYFENVSAGAQTIKQIPKSNRGVTVEYTITDIKS